jgi:hypothetical protein
VIGTDWLRRKAAARKPASGGIATVYRNPDDPTMPGRLDLGGGLLIAYAASGAARVISDAEVELHRALAEAAAQDAADLAEDQRSANCNCDLIVYSRCYPSMLGRHP